jgi:hypothetical protein
MEGSTYHAKAPLFDPLPEINNFNSYKSGRGTGYSGFVNSGNPHITLKTMTGMSYQQCQNACGLNPKCAGMDSDASGVKRCNLYSLPRLKRGSGYTGAWTKDKAAAEDPKPTHPLVPDEGEDSEDDEPSAPISHVDKYKFGKRITIGGLPGQPQM